MFHRCVKHSGISGQFDLPPVVRPTYDTPIVWPAILGRYLFCVDLRDPCRCHSRLALLSMTELSPAANAVLTAVTLTKYDVPPEGLPAFAEEMAPLLAAALRAAAEQRGELEIPFAVIDDWEKIKGSCASFYAAAEWGYRQALKDQRVIADELEAL